MAAPIHKFRPPACPRNRIHETCLILTAPFADWLRDGNQPANQPPFRNPCRGSNRAPGTIGQATVIVSPQPPAALTVNDMLRDGQPLPWNLDTNLSDIEYVVLNTLAGQHPEAFEYLMRKARERSQAPELGNRRLS